MDGVPGKAVKLSLLGVLFGGAAYASIDPETVSGVLNAALSHQVSQFTIAFSIAAWIHSGRVKKEIKNQLGGIIQSIDSVAQTLRQDLMAQGQRIGNIESSVAKISDRVAKIEKTETQEEQK